MKHKITITTILVLLSACAFGQNIRSEFKNELIPSSRQKLDSVITRIDSEYGLSISKAEYVYYPPTGDMLVKTTSDWNGVFWEPDTKWVCTYNGFHDLIQIDHYESDDLPFEYEGSERCEYTHNVFGELIQLLVYSRYEPFDMEMLAAKHEYSYSLDGKLEQVFSYMWDSEENAWKSSDKRDYTYDVRGNMTQMIYRNLAYGYNYPEDYEKFEYVYDANGNIIQEIIYYTDDNGNEVLEAVINYTYDNSYSDIIHPYCFYYEESLLYNHMLIKWENIDASGTFYYDASATFYYSELKTNSVTENSLVPVTVFPNPASDYINVNTPITDAEDLELNIFTVSGVMVRSEMLKQSNSKINIEDLSNGIYLLEIKSRGWVKKQKLIINR